MKKAILTTVAMTLAILAFADKKDDYRNFTDTIRAEVYAMDLPAFNVKDVPAKYQKESSVIKAIYEEVNARKKTGFGLAPGSFLAFTRKAQVRGSQLTRMLIHINDKAALEKYSELDFDTDSKTKNYDGYDRRRHTMGVRLIKPDGRIVDIDTSEFVEIEEGKKGEKKSRKLAIPALEIGDDIDLFYYSESKLQNVHPDPKEFVLRSDAPIMNYRIHCVIDDNLTTQYRALNGAPDFTVSRDEDKNYVLDLEMKDIEKAPRLWYDPDQQAPTVRMHIFNRRNSDEYTPPSARKDGLQANPEATKIQGDEWNEWDTYLGYKIWIKSGPQLVKDYIKDGKKIKPVLEKMVKAGEISPTEAADYAYNLLCYIYIGQMLRKNDTRFAVYLNSYLNDCKIPAGVGISTSDLNEPLDRLINFRNSTSFTRVEGDCPRLYFPPQTILAPSEMHPAFQGRKALMWRKEKERKKQPTTEADYFTTPATAASDNRNVTSIEASIDGTTLKIKRIESYIGATKNNALSLLSEEDINEGYKKYLNRYGLSVDLKETKKEAANRAERYADGRHTQKDDFKNEIRGYHDTDASEMTEARVLNIGIDPAAPELTYSIDYTMDNLVKRAGKNLILSAGKLMSGQIETLPSDRDRCDDIYMRNPREYITRIDLRIPDGYSVNAKSLSALNASVSNDAGCFDVKASAASPETVSIEITKRYNSAILPASKWSDMLKVLDAAAAWQSSTLILDRK